MTDRHDEDADWAAELALGLLEGEERAAAMRRMLSDRTFAAEVERWRAHFGDLFESWPEAASPAPAMDRVEAELDGRSGRRWGWPVAAALSSMAAALLLALLFVRPTTLPVADPTPGSDQPPAVASQLLLAGTLAGEGFEPVTAVYAPASGELRLTGLSVEADRSAELWAIGDDGVPRSLGLLAEPGSRLTLDAPGQSRVTAGTTLAISIEPAGGSPSDLPTGPVIATGTLSVV